MIIIIDTEKAFNKIQHTFVIKIINKQGIEVIYLNMTKSIYSKPKANFTVNGEKLKAFLLRSETRQGCLLLPLLNVILEVLVRAIRQEKEIKGTQNVKKEVKYLFVDDLILYAENSKDSTNKLLGLINEFSKVAGYIINR